MRTAPIVATVAAMSEWRLRIGKTDGGAMERRNLVDHRRADSRLSTHA
jgi:hypothetical protein